MQIVLCVRSNQATFRGCMSYLNDLFIEGGKVKRMPKITTFDDHRIAMAFTILSLTSFGKYELDNMQCVDISLPNFFNYLGEVTK